MLTVKNVAKNYRNKTVLRDIDFACEEGECVGIVGKNGCGKTTLVSILAGIVNEDQGSIIWNGKTVNARQRGKLMGFVPQENPLMEELTVHDNLYLWLGTKDLTSVIKKYQLEDIDATPVNKLSGGMKRRVTIACAMALEPAILIMDEPTSALDLYYREMIHSYMKRYLKENGIIILVTHEEEEICMCSRVFIMNKGEISEVMERNNPMTEIREKILSQKKIKENKYG